MYEDFFANRLAKLRIEKKTSARDMSLSIGQNASYINRIENKLAFPSMQVFFYICEYLNISPKEFFEDNNKYTLKEKEFINLLNQLDEEDVALLYQLGKLLAKKNKK